MATPILGLGILTESQEDKELVVNTNSYRLDAIVPGGVLARQSAPPGSPSEGDSYIVMPTATGLWAGQDQSVAYYYNSGWSFVSPSQGLVLFSIGDAEFYYYDGGGWIRKSAIRELWIGAGAMIPRTTSGAAPGTAESGTNKVTYDTLDFDSTTSEGACFQISFPGNWDRGTLKIRFYWTAASGSGTVSWAVRAGSIGDSDLIDSAYGSAVTATDTWLAAGDLHITSATPALTVAGTPQDNDWIFFEVYRDVADTLAVDAQLIGVKIQYTEGLSLAPW